LHIRNENAVGALADAESQDLWLMRTDARTGRSTVSEIGVGFFVWATAESAQAGEAKSW